MKPTIETLIDAAAHSHSLPSGDIARLSDEGSLDQLLAAARAKRDSAYGGTITYSRKVFIPLTQLCRNVCHYCTFAQAPRKLDAPYLSLEQVVEIARQGADAGCREALFTLGELPEKRYRAAEAALKEMGFNSTIDYLTEAARRVFSETGLLPHVNPGCLSPGEITQLRAVSPSMGMMLESASPRLCEKGMPHYGSPDKDPVKRLAAIEEAGKQKVPFTSGILIGIGETKKERVEALLEIRDLHERYGHIQEVIIQNFRAKPDTKMVNAPEPDFDELRWTIAMARLIFDSGVSVQAPPNLSPGKLKALADTGLNDWGGVSPLTPDFVNPEAPWPHVARLAEETKAAGKTLHERLTVYPSFVRRREQWVDTSFHDSLVDQTDSEGFPRSEQWSSGGTFTPPEEILAYTRNAPVFTTPEIQKILVCAQNGDALSEAQIVRLFKARGEEVAEVCSAADSIRSSVNGDTVTYAVNRNINYTNICYFSCRFCAFSKGKQNEQLRGEPYDLGLVEIVRRCQEASDRGATEVCLQGGIHPSYTGQTYIDICRAIKTALPDMHIHAFSPLEISQGAKTLGVPVNEFLAMLKQAGLGTLPGTAAEILDDRVRTFLCPDKLDTEEWLHVIRTAHSEGLDTTATIMYGHIDGPANWARHLRAIRELQQESLAAGRGKFTEFVPLPFVHMEAPIFLKGRARKGPTFREAVLMHAIARLALNSAIPNIQVSWTKMGPVGSAACLNAGVNDLGGTLMNESISRAAGASHGEEFAPEQMRELIYGEGRIPRQRATDYGVISAKQTERSMGAPELTPSVNELMKRPKRKKSALVQYADTANV
jgi:FO synthase